MKLLSGILLSFLLMNAFGQSTSPQIWVKKTLQDSTLYVDTIYHEGAPDSTRATVLLRAWASSDSILTGNPLDVVFLSDNTPKMGTRTIGDQINSTVRIQGAYYASKTFITNYLFGYNNRVSLFRLGAAIDQPFLYTNNMPHAIGQLDTFMTGGGGQSNKMFWNSLSQSARYSAKNYRSGIQPVIVATEGQSPGNLGDDAGYNALISLVDSIRNAGVPLRIFIVACGSGVNDNSGKLSTVADTSDGLYYWTADGLGLDSIFTDIGQKLMDIIGVSVSPTEPMLMDVLGPNIHYVPYSYQALGGLNYIVPDSFIVDTVNGLTRLKFMISQVKIGKFLDIRYQITAALYNPNITDTLMRVNNSAGDNPTHFSILQYKDPRDSSIVTKPLDKDFVLVKTSVGGLFLSYATNALFQPAVTKLIPLSYTFLTPGVYRDTLLYALLLRQATDTSQYSAVNQAVWNFTPNPNWTAPVLNNVISSSKIIGVTAPFNYTDTRTLNIQYTVNSRVYKDSLTFSVSDASGPSSIVSIGIDADTATPKTFTSRIVVTGNKTQLNAYRQALFARGLTNRDSVRNCMPAWSSSGFSLYAAQFAALFTGAAVSKTIALTVKDTSFAQSDSGNIRIDTAGISYSMRLVIIDTTDYDTTKLLAIYNNNYGNNTAQIETNYPLQSTQRYFTPDLSDTLTFWSMLFDSNATGIKYLGNKSAVWQLNGGSPVNSPVFGIRRTTALQSDRIIVTYVNEWSITKRDTVDISWRFGKKRYFSLESQPGVYGTTDSFPVASIVVPSNADTIRGFFAVVRDEYGYCVHTGQYESYAIWAFGDAGASAYLDKPADSTSTGWVYRKASPLIPTSYYLTAYGLPIDLAYQVDRDSVQVQLTNYTYTKLDIFAAQPLQGFSIGDTIPRNTEIKLRCDLSGHFETRALHGGSLYDVVSATWSVEPTDPFAPGDFPFSGSTVSLSPIKRTAYQHRLVAEYVSGATTLRDTIVFTVEPPTVTNLVLDSVKSLNNALSSISLTGNLSQLRNRYFWLFANAGYSCSGEPGTCVSATWSGSSTPNTPWFQSMVTAVGCSLYVDFNAIPNTPGDHSLNGTISIQYGAFTDVINISLKDTTEYDSLRYFVVDTARYAGNFYPYAGIQDLLNKRQPNLTYTYQAGQNARFYPLLFDLQKNASGQVIPKLLGADNAKWELHHGANGSITTSEAASYSYTSTTAHVSDTLIISYPATVRLLSDSAYPPKNFSGTQTIIIKWTPGSETRLKLLNIDDPYAGAHILDTLSMPLGVDSVKAYAFLFDQYGNYLFGNVASMSNAVTWASGSALYFGVPASPTHIGNLTRTATRPDSTAVYRVIATLPANTYLGDRYSTVPALDTVYVRMGSFTFDSLRIVTNNNARDFFTTTRDTIDGNNGLVTPYDTIVLRACEDTARFFASAHNTESGWQTVPITWYYNGVKSSPIVIPQSGTPQSFLSATFVFQKTLSDTIHFQIGDEYLERLYLTPPATRVVLSVNTSAAQPDTALSLAAHARSNCGNAMDSTALWSVSGFTNTLWRDSLSFYLAAGQATKLLQLGYLNSALFNQNDSGLVIIRKYDPILRDTLRDTLKLVLIDTTDYDTVKAMVIVPDTAYRNATDKNTLYSRFYNRSIDSLQAGDTLTLTALLFDFKKSGDQFLGAGQVPGNDANVFWYLNGSQSVDSVFSYHRDAPRLDTLVIVYKNSQDDTLSIKTFYLNWGFGKSRILRLESAKGLVGNTAVQDVDTLVFGLTKATDTVYAVIRDEFGNFISNEPLKWAMTPDAGSPAYISYLNVPNPQIPTATGWVYKHTNPPAEYTYKFHVTLPKGAVVAGITTATETQDSVHVVLAHYSFDQINIYSDASRDTIRDTARTIYPPDTDIPRNTVLFLTALEDTITLKAKIHRDDNTYNPWMSQPVDWVLTNPACVASAAFTKSGNVTLMPINSIALDTLIASYRVSGGNTLRDTVLFTVDIPWIAGIRVRVDSTNLIAGDTVHFTIELVDKNGNPVTNPNREPGSLTLTTNTDMLYLGPNYSQWINNTSLVVNNPFTSGVSTNALVNYVASANNRVIIEITYQTATGPKTFLDTITLNVAPAAPDSMVVIREAKSAPATLDTLTAYQDNLLYSSLSYRVDMYDIYGNLIPVGSAVYAPLAENITVTGNVLDHPFEVIARNKLSYRASGGENGGTAIVRVAFPRAGADTLSYAFNIMVIPVIRVQNISTHEWVADPVRAKTDVEFVMSRVLNLNINKLLAGHSASPDTVAKIYLDTLATFGFKPYCDGFLDYLDIRLSEPFYLTEDVIARIAFDTLISGKPDSIVWKLDTLGRTIRLQPVDSIQNDSSHYLWRLWLIPHTLDVGYSSTLETGLLPTITFNNGAIYARDFRKPIYPHIGSGTTLYTTPDSLTLDSAGPVVMKFMLQNNACNPDNPENSVHIGFSEPVRYQGFPNYLDVKGLVLLNPGSPADSVFMGSAILSGKRKNRTFNAVTAWNYNDEPDRMMTYELIIKPEFNKLFKANASQIRFAMLDPLLFEFFDLRGNPGTLAPSRSAILVNDPTDVPHICGVNGNTLVSNTASMNFSWGKSETGDNTTEQVPLFPYFGVTINLLSITAGNVARDSVLVQNTSIGGRCFVVCDFAPNYVLYSTEITIFDLLGNLVASPSSHKGLKTAYTVAQIRKFKSLGMKEWNPDLLSTLTLDDIENNFTIHPGPACDTLRPLYPTTLVMGYEFMKENCGPDNNPGDNICLSAWNCLNAKGRLVAPGGYIAHQVVRAGNEVSEVTRKLIVTNKK